MIHFIIEFNLVYLPESKFTFTTKQKVKSTQNARKRKFLMSLYREISLKIKCRIQFKLSIYETFVVHNFTDCFAYADLNIPAETKVGDKINVSAKVTNTGNRDGEEVVQLYLTDEKASSPRPIRQLEGFKRISLKKGESQTVHFTLEPRQLSMINNKDNQVIEPGWFTISVGGEQPGFTGATNAGTTETVSGRINMKGKVLEIK